MVRDSLGAAPAERVALIVGRRLLQVDGAAAGNSGMRMVVWRTFGPRGSPLHAATRTAGGKWSAPVTVSAPDAEVSRASVAMNARGQAAVVWQQSRGRHVSLMIATQLVDGRWSAPLRLDRHAAPPVSVAVSPGGAVTAAWVSAGQIRIASLRAARWTRSARLAVGRDSRVAVDVDAGGVVAAAWLVWPGPIVLASTGSVTRGWRAPQQLAVMPGKVFVAFGPLVGVARGGKAVAAWMTQRREGARSTVFVAEASRHSWTPPQAISAPAPGGSAVALDVNRRGAAIVTWILGAPVQRVFAARRDVTGTWRQAEPLSPPTDHAGSLDVAITPRGKVSALWTTLGRDREPGRLEVASAVGSEPWSAPVTLRRAGETGRRYTEAPRLAGADRRQAFAAWIADGAAGGRGRGCVVSTERVARRRPILGFGENHARVFSDPYWQSLGLPHIRLVVGWDALDSDWQRRDLNAWMAAARASHAIPLVAFKTSREPSPGGHLRPSVAAYKRSFRRFHALYPWVQEFTAWNEANHCGQLCDDPELAARYFDAMADVCPRCRIVAADVLDSPTMLRWLKAFRAAARHRPRIWGLHNYHDANRFVRGGTRSLLRAVKGEIWFTETGGLVHRANPLKGTYGPSVRHAAEATEWVLTGLAPLSPRIRRVYLYHFEHPGPRAAWDSGMLAPSGLPRPAYDVVCVWLRATACADGAH
jgi:hypothetical protein